MFITIFARSTPFHLVGMGCEGFPLPTSSMSLVMTKMTILMILIILIADHVQNVTDCHDIDGVHDYLNFNCLIMITMLIIMDV